MSSTIFIFYKATYDFEYPKLLKGWKWIGSGDTENLLFPKETQFYGSTENKQKNA